MLDSKNLKGVDMLQALHYEDIGFDYRVSLEKLLSRTDNSDTKYVMHAGLKQSDKAEKVTFSFTL